MKRGTTSKITAIIIAVIIVVAAAGAGLYYYFSLPSTTSATKASFMLDFTPSGDKSALYVGLDKGFFAKYGLAVNVIPNTDGGAQVARSVSSGAVDFGDADAYALLNVLYANNITNVRIIGIWFQHEPCGAVFNKHSGISRPADLQGKKIGATVGSACTSLFNIFAKINGINMTTIKFNYVGAQGLAPAVFSGAVDAITQYPYQVIPLAPKNLQESLGNFTYKDYGVDAYSLALVTNTNMIQNHPDIVKAFVQGFADSVVYTVKNPSDAITSFTKFNPQLNATQSLAVLQGSMPLLDSKNVLNHADKPLSILWVDPARMQTTISVASEGFGIPAADPASVYTDQFVAQP